MILAVAALAALVSCTDKKAAQSVADTDSTSVAGYMASEDDNLDLTSVAGIYEGTFPAADGPGIKTKLTIKADSTYQMEQNYVDQKDGHDEASGVFKVLEGNVLMLVRPSSGEHTFYKVKDAKSIVRKDWVGKDLGGETKKFGGWKKKREKTTLLQKIRG